MISCHTHRFEHIKLQYIYRICYKNAKKANPRKRICPYDMRKHNVFEIMSSFDQLQIAKGGVTLYFRRSGLLMAARAMLCLFSGHCGCFCEVTERVLNFFYDFNTFLDPMTFCQVFWIIIRKPYLPRFIFPD